MRYNRLRHPHAAFGTAQVAALPPARLIAPVHHQNPVVLHERHRPPAPLRRARNIDRPPWSPVNAWKCWATHVERHLLPVSVCRQRCCRPAAQKRSCSRPVRRRMIAILTVIQKGTQPPAASASDRQSSRQGHYRRGYLRSSLSSAALISAALRGRRLHMVSAAPPDSAIRVQKAADRRPFRGKPDVAQGRCEQVDIHYRKAESLQISVFRLQPFSALRLYYPMGVV